MAARRRNTAREISPPETAPEVTEPVLTSPEERPNPMVLPDPDSPPEIVLEAESPAPATSASERFRASIADKAHDFLNKLAACREELSSDNVHQMRVSSRRMSSALGMLAPIVGAAPVKKLRQQVRRARRSLGHLRDLQRQLEWLADEPLLDEYLTESAAQLPKQINKASKQLRKLSPNKMARRFENLDGLLAALLEDEEAEEGLRELTSRHIWETLLKAISYSEDADPDHSQSYHPFRLSLKTFRYQAELFREAGWQSHLDHNEGWSRLKKLHEALGRLQDLEVLSCHLDHHWSAYPPIRETQARILNHLLRDRKQVLAQVHLHDLDWESLWEWPKDELAAEAAEAEEAELESTAEAAEPEESQVPEATVAEAPVAEESAPV